jgi:4-amino-4-deoxy-L-arabinose transferase-like glycosyltransferase
VARRRRGALLVIAAVAALSYSWALGRDPLEPYYAAAVRSMSTSWHNFFFGAFDPAGTITLDKLPGAFWIQALAVRALGVHTWVIVLPQVVEGVLTVLVLYRAVARLAGPAAGLIAALILALSPATVALNRGNISDTLMILLLVLAADAVSAAVAEGRQARLILAAVLVGLAFQVKMIEAWMVLPAFALAYLLSAPGATRRRVRQLVVAGVVAGLVSLAWMIAVTLTPASHRPYVDGSHDNSIFEQVFVYNGFGRFGQQTPLQLLAGQSLGLGDLATTAAPGADRLLRGDLGRDTAWLLPAAVVAAVWGIASRRKRPRGDPLRTCFVLWGGWLATLGLTFSVITSINPYYTAALTPAVAALLGAGFAGLWSAERSGIGRRLGLAVVVTATADYATWLIPASGSHRPGWLVPVVIAFGVVAIGTILASVVVRSDTMFAASLAIGLLAMLSAPAVASAELVAGHQGAFDTPFEPKTEADFIDGVFLRTPAAVKLTIPLIESHQDGTPYLLAAQTSAVASLFIYDTGREALPIGGFTGTIPSPTLSQLQADIRQGRFHLVLVATTRDPRLMWIATHCLPVGTPTGTIQSYYCLPVNAG